jgi:hypothetical protein
VFTKTLNRLNYLFNGTNIVNHVISANVWVLCCEMKIVNFLYISIKQLYKRISWSSSGKNTSNEILIGQEIAKLSTILNTTR